MIRSKRDPGKWELEATGDHFIAVNAKSYVLTDSKNPSSTKLSCAGICRNNFNNLHVDPSGDVEDNMSINSNLLRVMEKVIFELKPHTVQNRNIVRAGGSVWTNISLKRGFSPLFTKRFVSADGCHTTPFHIVLKPRKNAYD